MRFWPASASTRAAGLDGARGVPGDVRSGPSPLRRRLTRRPFEGVREGNQAQATCEIESAGVVETTVAEVGAKAPVAIKGVRRAP
ncbi:MAG: hypothetical protein K0R38_7931 [Polyangiaceae bacterium]|nr:hypothetical protein [Polyangiaceae bacterium]